jgi:hypothetical protein
VDCVPTRTTGPRSGREDWGWGLAFPRGHAASPAPSLSVVRQRVSFLQFSFSAAFLFRRVHRNGSNYTSSRGNIPSTSTAMRTGDTFLLHAPWRELILLPLCINQPTEAVKAIHIQAWWSHDDRI